MDLIIMTKENISVNQDYINVKEFDEEIYDHFLNPIFSSYLKMVFKNLAIRNCHENND